MSGVSARFFVQSVNKNTSGYNAVRLSPAIRGKGNAEWAHYTPSGSIELNVKADSAAAAWFEEMLDARRDIAITFTERPEGELDDHEVR